MTQQCMGLRKMTNSTSSNYKLNHPNCNDKMDSKNKKQYDNNLKKIVVNEGEAI